MPTLSDKLKSLGVQVGARDLPPPRPRHAHAIESVMQGRVHATAFGDAFIVEQTYPPEYRHGSAALQITASLQTIADWAREERIAACAPNGFVFLDTETTGLAGGTGTFAFLVGIGRYDDSTFRLTQFFLRDPIEEPAMLAALTELLQPLDTLVTFNGKAFDVPLLNARYITNRTDTPFARVPHLDLLPLARRLWRMSPHTNSVLRLMRSKPRGQPRPRGRASPPVVGNASGSASSCRMRSATLSWMMSDCETTSAGRCSTADKPSAHAGTAQPSVHRTAGTRRVFQGLF